MFKRITALILLFALTLSYLPLFSNLAYGQEEVEDVQDVEVTEPQEEENPEEEPVEEIKKDSFIEKSKISFPKGPSVYRISGKDRYETSSKISALLYDKNERVIIASGENFPDALAAGVLANAFNAPILLAKKQGVPKEIEDEMNRLDSQEAYIIGGTGAIEQLASSRKVKEERIYGKNRYETAEKIAARFDTNLRGYSSGTVFPDALAAVPLLSKTNTPLLLHETGQKLEGSGYVFGGSGRIPDNLLNRHKRISGENRFSTAVNIAKEYGSFDTVIIASGENFPDALSAAALSKRYNAPILLTPKKGLSSENLDFLHKNKIEKYFIVGGKGAVSEKVEWQLNQILDPNVKYSLLPSPILPGQYEKEVQKAVEQYHNQGRGFGNAMVDYNPYGVYVDFLKTSNYRNTPSVKIDRQGNPMVLYNGDYYYNPVTIAQFAFSSYAEYLRGEKDSKEFLMAASKLVNMTGKDGALRYSFEWYNGNTGEVYEKGWTSAMAQGHALSVFTRAYKLTGHEKYLDAGRRVLDFLLLDKSQGGVATTMRDLDKTLANRVFFEEYVSTPNSYTLNGYIFTLLGLYDWATLTKDYPSRIGENKAEWAFEEGLESLQYVLHLYDVGGFTNYDLGYMNFDVAPRLLPGYHAIHIKLLHALYTITENPRFQQFSELWKSYV